MTHSEEVSNILERETSSTIANWLARVGQEKVLVAVQLTAEERCAHLPEMFADIVARLREPLPLGTRALMSDAAHDHGIIRRLQRYTAGMIVEESRILQVSIFQTLQLHQERLDMSKVMLDVMVIADEIDSQLAQAMASFNFEAEGEPGSESVAAGCVTPSDAHRNSLEDGMHYELVARRAVEEDESA